MRNTLSDEWHGGGGSLWINDVTDLLNDIHIHREYINDKYVILHVKTSRVNGWLFNYLLQISWETSGFTQTRFVNAWMKIIENNNFKTINVSVLMIFTRHKK